MLFTLEMTHFTGYLQVNWGSVILARLKPTHWLPACGNRAALPSGFWNRTGSFFLFHSLMFALILHDLSVIR